MLRIGILGAGQWGSAAHLASLRGHAFARVVEVANRTRAGAERAAREFGIDTVRDDPSALIESPAVEAVIVAAPVPEHRPLVLAAVAANKPVLCEGSLALPLEDGKQMCAAAAEAGVLHAYTLPRPWLYGGERVRELLSTGALGTPRSARLVFRGNPWLHASPETNWRIREDLVPAVLLGVTGGVLLRLFPDIASVSARLARHREPDNPGGHPLGPDYASVQASTAEGVELTVDAGAGGDGSDSGLALYGTEGSLHWSWARPGEIRVLDAAGSERDESVRPTGDLARDFPFARDFADAVATGNAPAVSFDHGVRELAFIDACRRSQRDGRRAELDA